MAAYNHIFFSINIFDSSLMLVFTFLQFSKFLLILFLKCFLSLSKILLSSLTLQFNLSFTLSRSFLKLNRTLRQKIR